MSDTALQPPETASRPEGRTTLYRLYDSTGDLAYVGIAGNPGRTTGQMPHALPALGRGD